MFFLLLLLLLLCCLFFVAFIFCYFGIFGYLSKNISEKKLEIAKKELK